mgnify:CR=1 FL=1
MNKQRAKRIVILMEGALDEVEEYCDELDLGFFTDSEVDYTTDIREKLQLLYSDISYLKDELED